MASCLRLVQPAAINGMSSSRTCDRSAKMVALCLCSRQAATVGFGLTGKEYSPEDLQRAASAVAGTDLAGFFSGYIASHESLPVKECLSEVGFEASIVDYGGEVYISPVLSPSASALAIRRRLFNGTP